MITTRNASVLLLSFLLLVLLSAVATAQNSNSTTTVVGSSNQDTTTTTTASSGETAEAAGRPKIAVHTFENPPNYYNSTIGNGLTSIIITNLVQSGRFDVIQRDENLQLIIDEIQLGDSGYIEPGSATEMGHVLGVQYILSGQVTNFGYEEQSAGGFLGGIGGFGGLDVSQEEARVRLDFSLIDATTGLTVLAATAEGTESNTGVGLSGGDFGNWIGSISFDSDEFMDSMVGHATIKAVNNLMDQILGLFPVQAPILAVTPDFVVIDIGANAGIEVGTILDVYRLSSITNSEGEVVWQDKTLVGKVMVTEVELTSSKAEIVSGSDFTEGDICILPEEPVAEEDDSTTEENHHRR
jgi:curli biogenesis system outer membrane secretion channel CsgG